MVSTIPPDFVYQNPTIRQLAAALSNYSSSLNDTHERNVADERRFMKLLIKKYTQDWPVHSGSRDDGKQDNEVFLVTGTTGSIGSQILFQLAHLPSVSRIYAFNRPGKLALSERHAEVWKRHGMNLSILQSEKIVYVEGDLSVYNFGLANNVYLEVGLISPIHTIAI